MQRLGCTRGVMEDTQSLWLRRPHQRHQPPWVLAAGPIPHPRHPEEAKPRDGQVILQESKEEVGESATTVVSQLEGINSHNRENMMRAYWSGSAIRVVHSCTQCVVVQTFFGGVGRGVFHSL